MKFGLTRLEDAEGAILAHAVTTGERTWRKASLLGAEDIVALEAAGITEVVAAMPGSDDIGENEAATLVAAGLAAPGIEVRQASTGRVNLHALDAGLFVVDRAAVDAVNSIDPAITMATLSDFSTVDAGQMLATVKIIPFAVDRSVAEKAAAITARGGLIGLHLFHSHKVGLLQTVLPSVKPTVLDKTARLTAERLRRSESTIMREVRVPHDAASVAGPLRQLARDNDMVIVFGASAVSDGEDVIPAAIRLAGGTVERVGMPVDPGNLLVIGEVEGKTVIGAPGCARSPKLNGFDWVLDRIMAGQSASDRDIAGMGVGGLLMEIETRPQPREPKARRSRHVHAVLLAAGRGERMGGPNKLLATFEGIPLVRRVANTLAASRVRSAAVVVGHQAREVSSTLHGLGVRLVENREYRTGLASSLKAGVAALPPDAAGALIVLGDMPAVSAVDLDRLIEAFTRADGAAVVRATHSGKRGNPVILPRALFPAIKKIEGDTGARHIVESSDVRVIDVEIGEAASLDVDTPEAMARAGGVLNA